MGESRDRKDAVDVTPFDQAIQSLERFVQNHTVVTPSAPAEPLKVDTAAKTPLLGRFTSIFGNTDKIKEKLQAGAHRIEHEIVHLFSAGLDSVEITNNLLKAKQKGDIKTPDDILNFYITRFDQDKMKKPQDLELVSLLNNIGKQSKVATFDERMQELRKPQTLPPKEPGGPSPS